MHIRKWRQGSCGYIGGGRILRSGGMHANIFWVRLANFFLGSVDFSYAALQAHGIVNVALSESIL
jgi:hypothetical protein